MKNWVLSTTQLNSTHKRCPLSIAIGLVHFVAREPLRKDGKVIFPRNLTAFSYTATNGIFVRFLKNKNVRRARVNGMVLFLFGFGQKKMKNKKVDQFSPRNKGNITSEAKYFLKCKMIF